jgi:hypothetical protein
MRPSTLCSRIGVEGIWEFYKHIGLISRTPAGATTKVEEEDRAETW